MYNNNLNVGALIVTHNGLEHLKKCLEGVRNQTYPVKQILVVNNNSSDGTNEWLDLQKDVTVISQQNLGSSGGEHTGMSYFLSQENISYIWCLDQDIITNNKTLENLVKYSTQYDFLSSFVMDNDNKVAWSNIPELSKPEIILNNILDAKPISILSASFGSLLFNKNILLKIGLPIKEFFIWGDDAEFTLRMVQHGYKGGLVTESTAIHNQANSYSNPYSNLTGNSLKVRLGLRNMVYVVRLRNRLTHSSSIRGYFSASVYFYKALSNNIKSRGLDLNFFVKSLAAFLRGLLYKPKIDLPNATKEIKK